MKAKGLEERREKRIAKRKLAQRVRVKGRRRKPVVLVQPATWSRDAVLSGIATYSNETLAELFWIGDRMEKAKKPK